MSYFEIEAGRRAYGIVREEGLRAERIRVILGAAGGPKWLVLYHLDRWISSELLPGVRHPVHFFGSSIGAWRLAAMTCKEPSRAIDNLFESYMNQRYSSKPSPREVTQVARTILRSFMPEGTEEEVLGHPFIRLNIATVRMKIGASENRLPLLLSTFLMYTANRLSRSYLRFFMDRVYFSDPRDRPPLEGTTDHIPIRLVELTPGNLPDALMASASIPLVMEGVRSIPGAPPGTYRDGGLIDYHILPPLRLKDGELALFPHYSGTVTPGWFDKTLRHRSPDPRTLENIVLVRPSNTFFSMLPDRKIPDRQDFYTFSNNPLERKRRWKKAVELGRRMAEEFAEAVSSGKIRDMVRLYGLKEGSR
ncbi:patatin-like phospholipase family protein [Thermodesulforhabdus norvegica]|uniref:PNPLA domain-containing protein n=1 Tax=Thermodesulforhabdus norvegica TaxID=39841 RepID=A0A1I4VIX5_9BACT|nr:patatin-like phospholipase family protein [Thermodesulforhabdus norvegica]SFN01093.1 hypothetical protein SAMN05660836_02305 [Thermodesulforhabdus norvegica]